jgi:hypothetical protein
VKCPFTHHKFMWTGLRSNLGHCNERAVTIHLSHGMTIRSTVSLCCVFELVNRVLQVYLQILKCSGVTATGESLCGVTVIF